MAEKDRKAPKWYLISVYLSTLHYPPQSLRDSSPGGGAKARERLLLERSEYP